MSGMHGDHDLGHTVAGWTGCGVALTGSATIGLSVCGARLPGVWAGARLVAAGGLITWVRQPPGRAKPSRPRPAGQWDWGPRDPMTAHAGCPACRPAGGPAGAAPREVPARETEVTRQKAARGPGVA